ncbi:hypothetical protein [Pseudonocardia sp. T1-2H]|uniref:hypothetical protein n=1 Tax=Pseudonocardia sp. T1-2H TaxID=3128899 RepID=UPI003100D58E
MLAGRCPADELLPGEGAGAFDPAAVPFPPGLFTRVPPARHRGPAGPWDTPGTDHGGLEPDGARPDRTASDQTQGVHP